MCEIKINKAKMYVFHEEEAKKSTDKVCSSLLHYNHNYVPNETNNILLYIDAVSRKKIVHW